MRGVGCVDIGVVFVTVWMVCVGGEAGGANRGFGVCGCVLVGGRLGK